MRFMYGIALLMAPMIASGPITSDYSHIESYFSPQDHVDTKLISLIEQENLSIKIAVYCLTHRGIIHALMEAQKRGVHVELIIDPFTIRARAPVRRIIRSGIDVFVWDPSDKQMNDRGKFRTPLMHNKFCVFSKLGIVWTGSFNFTSEGALANQENVIVMHDSAMTASFAEQFERIKLRGCKTTRDFFASSKQKGGKK